ncbi:hypothetical protein CEXT_18621 [Caerostris extrusa]|uniref:Uncharacterized protein n=1 Tax=Caerostris extrusa TaxID=172846 RepID=A0AAV4Q144_CAEEX|nr:hypothetical protein CEXT_18621 [Caerostris extrusa]
MSINEMANNVVTQGAQRISSVLSSQLEMNKPKRILGIPVLYSQIQQKTFRPTRLSLARGCSSMECYPRCITETVSPQLEMNKLKGISIEESCLLKPNEKIFQSTGLSYSSS